MHTSLNKLRLLAPALVALLLCALPARAALKVGDPIPDLSSMGLQGTLPDMQGKVVLLDFWASWCAPCRASFPAMDELQATYGPQGFTVLAVNVDSEKGAMEKFLKKVPAAFPVVHDAQQKLVAAVGPETMPTSLLIGRDGKVHAIHSGFHGDKTRKEYADEITQLLSAQ